MASNAQASGDTVDLGIVSTDLNTDETPLDSMSYLARRWIQQDKRFEKVVYADSWHDAVETMRRACGPNQRIRRMIIASHGRQKSYDSPFMAFDQNVSSSSLDLSAARGDIEFKRKDCAQIEARIREYQADHDRYKRKADKDKMARMIAIETSVLNDAKAALASATRHELDLIAMRDVMAPGAEIFLINCSPAQSASDAGPLVKGLARLMLSERGGSIRAATGPVRVGSGGPGTQVDRDRMDANLPQLLVSTAVADAFRRLAAFVGGDVNEYFYVGQENGTWVTLPVDARPKAGLNLGRLFMDGDVFRVTAGPDGQPATVQEMTQFLMSGAATFKRVYCPPIDPWPPAPASVELGSASIDRPGVIRYRMRASPPNPATWTQQNSNARLELKFVANGSVSSESSDPWLGESMEGAYPVNGPCTVSAAIAPAFSCGVYGGEYLAQTASAQLEFVADNGEKPILNGDIVQNGDRITTGGAKALLRLTDGSRILLRENTSLRLVTMPDGALRGEVETGSLYVHKRGGGGRKLEFRFGRRVIRPRGTVISGWSRDDRGIVQVLEGAADVEMPGGVATIETGRELDLATGEIAENSGDWNMTNDFGGYDVESLPFETADQPPVSASGAIAADVLGGWTFLTRKPGWGQTESDRCLAEAGALKVETLPDSCDETLLWRPLTGDFEVELDLALRTHAADSAFVSAFVFAEGSGIGRDIADKRPLSGFRSDMLTLGGIYVREGVHCADVRGYHWSESREARPLKSAHNQLRIVRSGQTLALAVKADDGAWPTLSQRNLERLKPTLWLGLKFGHRSGDSFERQPIGNTTVIFAQTILSKGAPHTPPA